MDYFDISYLSNGSPIQRKGFHAITSLGIINSFKEYTPVIVGTLPLDLFTDKSDIDVLCYFPNPEEFAEKAFFALRVFDNFHIDRRYLGDVDSIIVRFNYGDFDFEIVGQKIPVTEQLAFRHMVAEWRILSEQGGVFKQKVLDLKKSGIKTEPAFAQLLGLKGDPYDELLRFF